MKGPEPTAIGAAGGKIRLRPEALGPRLRLALAVQVGQRAGLLLVADAIVLFQGVLAALLGGGEPDDFYVLTALVPVLLLGPLALADLVALEKRSGTLDLSLSLGSRETLFLMRAAVVAALVWVQAGGVMVAVWASQPEAVPLAAALAQLAAVCALTAAAALFWAVHLGGAGATWVATVATVAGLGPWTFFNPVPARLGELDLSGSGSPGGAGPFVVVVGAALLLIAYALRRLRRPETLLH